MTAVAVAEFNSVTAVAVAEFNSVTAVAVAEFNGVTAVAVAEFNGVTAVAVAEFNGGFEGGEANMAAVTVTELHCRKLDVSAVAVAEFNGVTAVAVAEFNSVAAVAMVLAREHGAERRLGVCGTSSIENSDTSEA